MGQINDLVRTVGEVNTANGWHEDDGSLVGPASPVTRIAELARLAIPLAQAIEAIRKPAGAHDLAQRLKDLEFHAGSIRRLPYSVSSIYDQERGLPLHGSMTQAISRQVLKITEVVEGIEAIKAGDVDNLAEELADEVIRTLDSVYAWNQAHPGKPIDLEAAILSKIERNRQRGYRHGGKLA